MDNQQLITAIKMVKVLNCYNIKDDKYSIDEFGNVYDIDTGYKYSAVDNSHGYLRVTLKLNDGSSKKFRVHRLVAAMYLGGESELDVNHIDGNKYNNHYKNLEYCTKSENIKHAYRIKLMNINGSRNPKAIYTDDDIHLICSLMEKGVVNSEISNITNIDIARIKIITVQLKSGAWSNISSNYNLNTTRGFKLNQIDVENICNMFEKGGDVKYVHKFYPNVSITTIIDIYVRRRWKKVSINYKW